MEKDELNKLTEKIIGAGIEVHRELGPGLLESAYEGCLVHELRSQGVQVERQKELESAYEGCLVHELRSQGVQVERQKELPIVYKGIRIDCGYKLDLLVEGKVVVELKAVENLHPVHDAQLMSYLRLSGCKVGLLMNFNVTILTKGIRRKVNNFPE